MVIYFAPVEFGCSSGRVSGARMAPVKPHGWSARTQPYRNLSELDNQIINLLLESGNREDESTLHPPQNKKSLL